MKVIVSKDFAKEKPIILSAIRDFSNGGKVYIEGSRNIIKLFPLGKGQMNIKSFKIPNAVNKIAYRFLRKSKAQRSYEYAKILVSKGIGTPAPIAYAEEKQGLFFGKSFYLCEHLPCNLTYRTLVQERHYPDAETILKAFTRFTFALHENQIEFLDHSPGNTLIREKQGTYEFFLVDLNRMNFKEMNFDARMKNFARLTYKREMVEVMAREYSHLYSRPEEEVFAKMWYYTQEFQEKFQRKKALKKKLKFWKK